MVSNAWLKSSSIILMKAVVKPQPGQLTPNVYFQMHGIQISMPETAFSIEENKI